MYYYWTGLHKTDDVWGFTSGATYTTDQLDITGREDGERECVAVKRANNHLKYTSYVEHKNIPVCERNIEGMYTRSHVEAQLISL